MYNLQPEKKSSGCLRIFAIIGIVAIVLGAGIVGLLFFASGIVNLADSSPTTHNVVYRITTNRDSSVYPSCYGFDVTYEMLSGTSQRSVSICDGAKSAEVDRFVGSRGDFVYLSVQNDEYLARITCEIHIDGKRVYQTSSEGQYVIASCSGSIP